MQLTLGRDGDLGKLRFRDDHHVPIPRCDLGDEPTAVLFLELVLCRHEHFRLRVQRLDLLCPLPDNGVGHDEHRFCGNAVFFEFHRTCDHLIRLARTHAMVQQHVSARRDPRDRVFLMLFQPHRRVHAVKGQIVAVIRGKDGVVEPLVIDLLVFFPAPRIFPQPLAELLLHGAQLLPRHCRLRLIRHLPLPAVRIPYFVVHGGRATVERAVENVERVHPLRPPYRPRLHAVTVPGLRVDVPLPVIPAVFDPVRRIPAHIPVVGDEVFQEVPIIVRLHPRRAHPRTDLAARERFRLHADERFLVMFEPRAEHVLVLRLRRVQRRKRRAARFQLLHHVPRKVLVPRAPARVSVCAARMEIGGRKLLKNMLFELRDDFLVPQPRQTLDIPHIHAAHVVTAQIHSLEHVVRMRLLLRAADRALREYFRLFRRLCLFVVVLQRGDKRIIVVAAEQHFVLRRGQAAVTLDERVILRVQLRLLFRKRLVATSVYLDLNQPAYGIAERDIRLHALSHGLREFALQLLALRLPPLRARFDIYAVSVEDVVVILPRKLRFVAGRGGNALRRAVYPLREIGNGIFNLLPKVCPVRFYGAFVAEPPAYPRKRAENVFGVFGKMRVQRAKPVRLRHGVYPRLLFRLLRGKLLFPLAEKQDIRHRLRARVPAERVIRQTVRAQQLRALCKVSARTAVRFIQRPARRHDRRYAARTQFVQSLCDEIVVDEEVFARVCAVVELVIPERHVPDNDVVSVLFHRDVFKPAALDLRLGIQRFSDLRRKRVYLHAVEREVHSLGRAADEIPRPARRLQHPRAAYAQPLQARIDPVYDRLRREVCVQRALPRTLVLAFREQVFQLAPLLRPARLTLVEYLRKPAPADVLCKDLLFSRRRRSFLRNELLHRADRGNVIPHARLRRPRLEVRVRHAVVLRRHSIFLFLCARLRFCRRCVKLIPNIFIVRAVFEIEREIDPVRELLHLGNFFPLGQSAEDHALVLADKILVFGELIEVRHPAAVVGVPRTALHHPADDILDLRKLRLVRVGKIIIRVDEIGNACRGFVPRQGRFGELFAMLSQVRHTDALRIMIAIVPAVTAEPADPVFVFQKAGELLRGRVFAVFFADPDPSVLEPAPALQNTLCELFLRTLFGGRGKVEKRRLFLRAVFDPFLLRRLYACGRVRLDEPWFLTVLQYEHVVLCKQFLKVRLRGKERESAHRHAVFETHVAACERKSRLFRGDDRAVPEHFVEIPDAYRAHRRGVFLLRGGIRRIIRRYSPAQNGLMISSNTRSSIMLSYIRRWLIRSIGSFVCGRSYTAHSSSLNASIFSGSFANSSHSVKSEYIRMNFGKFVYSMCSYAIFPYHPAFRFKSAKEGKLFSISLISPRSCAAYISSICSTVRLYLFSFGFGVPYDIAFMNCDCPFISFLLLDSFRHAETLGDIFFRKCYLLSRIRFAEVTKIVIDLRHPLPRQYPLRQRHAVRLRDIERIRHLGAERTVLVRVRDPVLPAPHIPFELLPSVISMYFRRAVALIENA